MPRGIRQALPHEKREVGEQARKPGHFTTRQHEILLFNPGLPLFLTASMSESDLKTRIKEMLVGSLMLKMEAESIGDDTPLFAPEGLALDSIDALELAVSIEKNFGVATPNAEVAREAFVSVNTIAKYLSDNDVK